MRLLKRFMVEEVGATAIEYGLIASLIAAAIVIAVTGVGTAVQGRFETVETALP